MIEIHKKIRELRLQKGLTLKQLSEKTNLTIGFLSQVERGTSSLAITSLKKLQIAWAWKFRTFSTRPSQRIMP